MEWKTGDRVRLGPKAKSVWQIPPEDPWSLKAGTVTGNRYNWMVGVLWDGDPREAYYLPEFLEGVVG